MNVVMKSDWKILPLALKDKKFRSLTTAVVAVSYTHLTLPTKRIV